ncbi:MAG: T9SS type A sorting domain-containing protein [Bacteroidetes bacterium]|nr:T9SS type A sorting domain-containing protein [Bacteroidota bacterium]
MRTKLSSYLITLLSIIIIFFSSDNLFPQSSWFSINNSEDINGLDFVSSSVVYGAGGNGYIFKSTDSGNSWEKNINNASASYLWSVSFADEQTGWAVGNSGTVIRTTDGGDTWTQQYAGTNFNLIDVHFINNLTGWIAGHNGTVRKTTNGGTSWFTQTTGNLDNIFEIRFIDSETGYLSGDAGIFRTTNGGDVWSVSLNEPWVYSVDFINAYTGWAGVRFGKIYKTINGGNTWTPQNSGTGATYYSMKFINENTGWAVGDYNTIIKTTNSGINWSTQISGVANSLAKFSRIDTYDEAGNICWIAGFEGTLLKTENGGANWETYFSSIPLYADLWSVYFTDDMTGWTAGSGGSIYKTTNGGNQWKISGQGIVNDLLIDVFFADQNNGWIVGHNGRIIRTVSGGEAWQIQNSGTFDNLFNVFFIDNNTGWVAGDNGIIRTVNGGANWTSSLNYPWMYSVFFINENTGWAGGRFGKLVKTTNGGNTWTDQQGGTGATYYSVKFSDENKGWAVGDYNTIIRTENGGLNWTQQSSGIPGTNLKLSEIHIAKNDDRTAYISSYNNYIFKTTNSGANWYKTVIPGYSDFNSIYFSSDNIGYAVGYYARIMKTSNGGVTFAGIEYSSIPGSFSLGQNYPNPFNPKTVIKYQVPASGNVSLKVYDIIGNEIAVLVDKLHNAGSYSVEFNGNNFSSGIYFYRIQYGNISDTKKMMLIK